MLLLSIIELLIGIIQLIPVININTCFLITRGSPFENTLTILEDPASNRQLYLIGTINSSTLLAKRTRDLIRDLKPNTLFVQTNETWWKLVNQIKGVQTQNELNIYNKFLTSAYNLDTENCPRGLIFKLRFYPWLLIMSTLFSNSQIYY